MNKNVIYDDAKHQFALGNSEGGVIDFNPDEMHRVIVTGSAPRTLTDFKGTILIVKNGLDDFDSFTLNFSNLESETRKLTIMFSFDCGEVKTEGLDGAKLTRFPDSVKEGDVWNVAYDKFFNTWYLVSCNSIGTEREVMGFSNGVQTPVTINIGHLTDIGGFPSFQNGVLTATAMNSDTKKGFLSFTEFSEKPKAGTFPMYGENGTLKVTSGVYDNDAVNLWQLYNIKLRVPETTVRGGVLKQNNIPELEENDTIDYNTINKILRVLRYSGLMSKE